MQEVYVSVDVEFDGPIPGRNSMLSIGAAAYVLPGTEPIATFEVNLIRGGFPGAVEDPSTMKWWETQPEAWDAHRKNTKSPKEAMQAFADFLGALPGTPVFVAYPCGADFTFVYWYFHYFLGHCPFGYSGIDIESLVMVLKKQPIMSLKQEDFPKHWFRADLPHTHIALDDAKEQGYLFVMLMQDLQYIKLPPVLERVAKALGLRHGMTSVSEDEWEHRYQFFIEIPLGTHSQVFAQMQEHIGPHNYSSADLQSLNWYFSSVYPLCGKYLHFPFHTAGVNRKKQ